MVQNPSDTPQTVARSSFSFLSGTFLSRLSGLGRDTTMAIAFGSHPAIAAFMVAFRFANLLRRLFGEGALSSGFIPHFEELRASSSKNASKFVRDLFFSLSLFLILLIGGLEILLWGVSKWAHLNPDNAEIIQLTMWMLPGALFICLFGLCSGLLQCERRFFLTGFAPAAINAVWIGAALLLKEKTLPLPFSLYRLPSSSGSLCNGPCSPRKRGACLSARSPGESVCGPSYFLPPFAAWPNLSSSAFWASGRCRSIARWTGSLPAVPRSRDPPTCGTLSALSSCPWRCLGSPYRRRFCHRCRGP